MKCDPFLVTTDRIIAGSMGLPCFGSSFIVTDATNFLLVMVCAPWLSETAPTGWRCGEERHVEGERAGFSGVTWTGS